MRVTVDRDVCTGHGRCYALAPGVFDADDDGYCVVITETVSDELAPQAELGARNCPEDAITLHDD